MSGCCPPSRGGIGTTGRIVVSRASDAASGLVRVSGGTFLMGTEDADGCAADGEGPVRDATVAPFAIDPYCVSNATFAAFVDATGYRTDAERFGWSYVFARFVSARLRKQSPRPEQAPWWCAVPGAYWREPEGPGSGVDDRWEHPVVHTSWNDAQAYCAWAQRRLPTETEWEYAARGGLRQTRYPWGDELEPGGEHRCNIWQGQFPVRNTVEDGYAATAPVDAFEPNGFGLYNVAGNVWEWCANQFESDEDYRAMRGGSYLCHSSYCNRYRLGARTANSVDSSSGNLGFRCVADTEGSTPVDGSPSS